MNSKSVLSLRLCSEMMFLPHITVPKPLKMNSPIGTTREGTPLFWIRLSYTRNQPQHPQQTSSQLLLSLPMLHCHPENDPALNMGKERFSKGSKYTFFFHQRKHFSGVIRKARPLSYVSLKGQDDRITRSYLGRK